MVIVGVEVIVGVLVMVGVSVGVNVCVLVDVGVSVGVLVRVLVGVGVKVGVVVGVSVGVSVAVLVGVKVGEGVMVGLGVMVGVKVLPSTPALYAFILDVRKVSITPWSLETRWVMIQLVSEELKRVSNCRKGVMKGWLKSTITITVSPGPPASSPGSWGGVLFWHSLYVVEPVNPGRVAYSVWFGLFGSARLEQIVTFK